MTPAEVTHEDVPAIRQRLMREPVGRLPKAKLKRGDHVRLSKVKSIFEKGYTPNWGTEVFRITKVKSTRPITYEIEDLNGVPVKGGFYAQELQKTRYKDIYLVEKVIKRDKDRVFVKWLGFSDAHNSWIKASDIF